MGKLKRLTITESFSVLSVLDGVNIDNVEQQLRYELENYLTNRKMTNVVPLKIWLNVDYYYENTDLELRFTREETDEEYEKRVKITKEINAKNKARREAAKLKEAKSDRELYLKLKEKYGFED